MKKTIILAGILVVAAAVVFPLVNSSGKLSDRGRAAAGRPFSRTALVGNLPVTIKGVPGRSLRIHNAPKLTSLEQLDSYVHERRGRLQQLAAADPDREIEVAVSPAQKLSLKEFGRKCRQHELAVKEISLDVFVEDKWDRLVWFDETTAVVDITADSETLARRIIEVESTRPSGPAEPDGAGPHPLPRNSVGLAVRFARGRLKAEAALRLQGDQSIMLVDPVTDLQDSFKGQADEVRVVRMPHLYVERELQFGSLYSPQNRHRPEPKRSQPNAQ